MFYTSFTLFYKRLAFRLLHGHSFALGSNLPHFSPLKLECMKFQTLNFGGAAVLALLLTSCIIHIPYNRDYYEIMSMGEYFGGMQKISKNMEKATAMMPGNEFERQAAGQDKNFHYNPLLLNGKPLNYANFSMTVKEY